MKQRELCDRLEAEEPSEPRKQERGWRRSTKRGDCGSHVAGLNARHDRGDSCCGASLVNYSMALSDGVGCALGWGCGDVPVGAPVFAYSYAAKSSEPTAELTISAAHPSTPSLSRTNAPIPSHFPAIALQGLSRGRV